MTVRGPLLTPYEAARYLQMHPKTLLRWADQGRIRCVRTPGGHRRYYERDLKAARAAAQRKWGR